LDREEIGVLGRFGEGEDKLDRKYLNLILESLIEYSA
jgi:hypothetical protein